MNAISKETISLYTGYRTPFQWLIRITARILPALFFIAIVSGCVSGGTQSAKTYRGHNIETSYLDWASHQTNRTFEATGTFKDYYRYALLHNPRIRAAFEQSKADTEKVIQTKALPDPSLSLEYMIDQIDTRYKISLKQMYPGFGKRGLRAETATAYAQAAWHRFEAARFELQENLAKAFYNYHYLARAIEVTEKNILLLNDLEMTVDSRYRAGSAAFAELIKTQVEKDRLKERLASLRDQRKVQSTGLSSLLNLKTDKLLDWPQFEASSPVKIDDNFLNSMLEELNPELNAAERLIEAGRSRKKLAQRNGLPDFLIGAEWMVMPGMNGRSDETDAGVMIGLTLPVWRGKVNAGIQESEHLLNAAGLERDAMRNRLRAELSAAVFQLNESERRINLLNDSLIPKAEKSLTSASQTYADGSTELMTVIDAHRTLLEFQLQTERAGADREIAISVIGRYTGLNHDGLTISNQEKNTRHGQDSSQEMPNPEPGTD